MAEICVSTAYLAPVEYYWLMAHADKVWLEQWEYYDKQSYRNRCHISTANGIMPLSIPVEKNGKTLIRDIRISDHGDWQAQHWRAIESAYNSSPFFEYYKDDFIPFFEKKWDFLWDFNAEIQSLAFDLLDFSPNIELTTQYFPTLNPEIKDFRNTIHPKRQAEPLFEKPYYQVFSQRFGFQPSLSIIDLLFNMGNESQLILFKKQTINF